MNTNESPLLERGKISRKEFSLFEVAKHPAGEKKSLKYQVEFKKAIDTNEGTIYPPGKATISCTLNAGDDYQGNCLMEKMRSTPRLSRTIIIGETILLESTLIITDVEGNGYQLKSPNGLLSLNGKINIH